MIRAARAARKMFIQNDQPNAMFFFENRQFSPNYSPHPFFYEMIKAARAARKMLYKMPNQTQLSSLKIGTVRQIVPPIFHQMVKAARAAREKYILDN